MKQWHSPNRKYSKKEIKRIEKERDEYVNNLYGPNRSKSNPSFSARVVLLWKLIFNK